MNPYKEIIQNAIKWKDWVNVDILYLLMGIFNIIKIFIHTKVVLNITKIQSNVIIHF